MDIKKDSSPEGIKRANSYEVMLAGCFTIYFSFFQSGKAFSRLDFKNLKTENNNELFLEMEKTHSYLQEIRNKHYAHKDNAMNAHILTIYNTPLNNNDFLIKINNEESYPVYLFTDLNFIKIFDELMRFVYEEINRLLKETISDYESSLNLPNFKDYLKNIQSYNFVDFQKKLQEIQHEKKIISRDEYLNKQQT